MEKRFREDGSRSLNEFINHAVDFYLGYLNTGGNTAYLEPALRSAIDGRLGMFEDRVARLLYKLAVEQDMVAGILADAYQMDEDYLRRRRASSVSNVKRTNGQLSFEQLVRQQAAEDDAWPD